MKTSQMDKLRYSIMYAVLRPEISEQVSVGVITVVGDKVNVRISRQKLNAIQKLFSEKEYKFLSRVVTQIKQDNRINSVDALNYLTRYSNNLLTFSPLQSIDIEPTEQSQNWLYRNYVYRAPKRA